MPAGALLIIAATSLLQTCTITGSVVEAGNDGPVSRAQVAVEGGQEIGAATDANGRFSIAAELCGKVQLAVSKSGFETQRLSQDDSEGILVKLQRVSEVTGIVSDADGQPIPDAVVDAGIFFPDSPVSVPPGMTATVSQSGEYVLKLPPFPYMICAHSSANVYPVGGGRKLRYVDRCINTAIDAGQQQRLDITLTALPPVHVSGSVAGTPEGAVPVVSIYKQGRETGSPLAVKSALSGLYGFADVLPDVYTIQATAVYGDKAFYVSEDVTVGSGGIANLALTLLPSIDLTGSLRFKSSSGQRARVRLDLIPSSGSVEWNEAGDSFTLSNVLQRKYRLAIILLKDDGSAGGVDFYVQSVRMRDQDVQGREFSVVGGAAPIDIVLADDFGTVAGTVTDAEGKPVSSGVWVSRQGYVIRVSSDDLGRIRPIKIPPGEYMVYAADGMQRDAPEGASKVEVPPSENVNVALKRVDRQ